MKEVSLKLKLQHELTSLGFKAQGEEVSTDKVVFMYALGSTACTCCAEVEVQHMEEVAAWYAEEIRKAKEEAWDEGCESGEANEGCGVMGTEDAAENPYRKEKND